MTRRAQMRKWVSPVKIIAKPLARSGRSRSTSHRRRCFRSARSIRRSSKRAGLRVFRKLEVALAADQALVQERSTSCLRKKSCDRLSCSPPFQIFQSMSLRSTKMRKPDLIAWRPRTEARRRLPHRRQNLQCCGLVQAHAAWADCRH
jgi:hypothetical protein